MDANVRIIVVHFDQSSHAELQVRLNGSDRWVWIYNIKINKDRDKVMEAAQEEWIKWSRHSEVSLDDTISEYDGREWRWDHETGGYVMK